MMMTRRNTLALGGAAAAALLARPHIARAAAPFERPELPYGFDALEPAIGRRTVELHSTKHHQSYFTKLNALVEGTPYADMELPDVYTAAVEKGDTTIANNAGQAWNHILYFNQFAGRFTEPTGALAESINRDFGGTEGLTEEITAKADTVFGTGWVWLVADGDALELVGTEDGDNPLPSGKVILMGIDLWEHAYYLDYQNQKAAHLKAVLGQLINWEPIGERFG